MTETRISIDPTTGEFIKLSDFNQGVTEAAFYQMLDHPNIVKINKLEIVGTRVQLRMKKLTRIQDLKTRLNIKQLLVNIIDALAYLHVNDILHNDIKIDNILYDEDSQQYILIDFGISTRFKICHVNRTCTFNTRAPELFYNDVERNYQKYKSTYMRSPQPPFKIEDTLDSRSDIFSLGATLYEIFTGHTWHSQLVNGQWVPRDPESTDEQEIDILLEAQNRNYLSHLSVSQDYYNLISRMMALNPIDRPTAIELAHELGVYKPYLKVRAPVMQIPTGWTQQMIDSIIKEINIIREYTIRYRSDHLQNNAVKLSLTFFSLKPNLNKLLIPLYLYTALKISDDLCTVNNDEPNYPQFLEYLSLWQEGEGSKDNLYEVFDINGSLIPDKPDINDTYLEMASTVNFRTLFSF
jgi:serine/threonine protein kinase